MSGKGIALLRFLKDAEQSVLSRLAVACAFLRLLHRLVQHFHQLRPPPQRIHRAALDQRLQHALVQQPQIHLLAELENVIERAITLTQVEVISPEDLPTPMAHEEDKNSTGKALREKYTVDQLEKEYIKKDGTIFPITIRIWLIKDAQGNPAGMWAFIRDITGQKQAEELVREKTDELTFANQELDAFISASTASEEAFPAAAATSPSGTDSSTHIDQGSRE